MFNIGKTSCAIPSLDAPEEQKIEAWKNWAALEVQNRAVLGHYLLDGHIAQFSGYESCARHTTNPLHMPASDAAFEASTVDEWILEMQQGGNSEWSFRALFVRLFSPPQIEQALVLSNFTLRILLEGMQSLVAESHQANGQIAVGTPSKNDIAKALVRLHNTHLRTESTNQLELLIRWHSICLELAVPSTSLCQRLCVAHGIEQTLHTGHHTLENNDFKEWSQSPDCLRALLHCMAILEIVEKLPLGRSHSIHLPAAIFAVSTVYSARCLSGFPVVTTPRTFSWGNIWKVDPECARDLSTSDTEVEIYLAGRLSKVGLNSCTKNLMYELNTLHIMLQRIERWGVSHEMDAILNRWMTIVNERNTNSAI
jgi:hypothetical protein